MHEVMNGWQRLQGFFKVAASEIAERDKEIAKLRAHVKQQCERADDLELETTRLCKEIKRRGEMLRRAQDYLIGTSWAHPDHDVVWRLRREIEALTDD